MLEKELKEQKGEDIKVILASDEEGNNFGNIAEDFGIHRQEEIKVLALYPEDYIDGQNIE